MSLFWFLTGVAAKATPTMPTKEASKTVVWRCPICTYDNEDSMSACDICGVLRNPLVKNNTKTDNVAGITPCNKNFSVFYDIHFYFFVFSKVIACFIYVSCNKGNTAPSRLLKNPLFNSIKLC